jgi:hypothetical protein
MQSQSSWWRLRPSFESNSISTGGDKSHLLPAHPLLYAPFVASVENDNLVMSPSNAFGLAFVDQMGLELQKRDARSQSMMCSSDAAITILDVPVLKCASSRN